MFVVKERVGLLVEILTAVCLNVRVSFKKWESTFVLGLQVWFEYPGDGFQ